MVFFRGERSVFPGRDGVLAAAPFSPSLNTSRREREVNGHIDMVPKGLKVKNVVIDVTSDP